VLIDALCPNPKKPKKNLFQFQLFRRRRAEMVIRMTKTATGTCLVSEKLRPLTSREWTL
jgi:hypothetical protein